MPCPPISTIRGLLLLVAIVALVMAGYVSICKTRDREQRLVAELRAERLRAQGYQRLVRLAITQDGSTPSVELRRELDEETARFQAEAARRRLGTTKGATR